MPDLLPFVDINWSLVIRASIAALRFIAVFV